AQRVKLAAELQKRSTGQTLYVLDEPTTGLHFEDIRKLLSVLGRLVDAGNTVIIIEHNLDVIKTADWLVDLGPEGGSGGGHVIAEGTPEDVAANAKSYTGQFLAPYVSQQTGGAGSSPVGGRCAPPGQPSAPVRRGARAARSPAAAKPRNPTPDREPHSVRAMRSRSGRLASTPTPISWSHGRTATNSSDLAPCAPTPGALSAKLWKTRSPAR